MGATDGLEQWIYPVTGVRFYTFAGDDGSRQTQRSGRRCSTAGEGESSLERAWGEIQVGPAPIEKGPVRPGRDRLHTLWVARQTRHGRALAEWAG